MAMEFTDEQFKELLVTIGSHSVRGSLTKCSATYDGDKNPDVLEVFLSHVEAYKHCEKITNSEALNAIHYLLKDEASLWWNGVKDSVTDWFDFLTKIRNAFAPRKFAYILYEEIMSEKQLDEQRTEDFVVKKRLLFSQLPKPGHPECQQIDMIYWLLNSKIKNAIPRSTIYSFEGLLEAAENIEKVTKEGPTEKKPLKKRRAGNRCNFCRMRGHIAEICLKKKKKIMAEAMVKETETTQVKTSDIQSPESPPPEFVDTCYGCGAPGVVRSKCLDCKGKMTLPEHVFNKISFV